MPFISILGILLMNLSTKQFPGEFYTQQGFLLNIAWIFYPLEVYSAVSVHNTLFVGASDISRVCLVTCNIIMS